MSIENYEKIKKIGKGSFGNVLLVKEKSTNKLLALKKVQFETNSKLNPINEVELLTSLDHCNIIKCYGYFPYKEKLCIIMEYADDGDLLKIVKEAKKANTLISEQEIINWFTQICLALKFLHDKNILHRDIKIQNIFLMKTGMIKLGDFGISKKLQDSSELAQTSLGTPYYLSPELCSASPYGKKTDIWMLGCLLYELCSLEKPFSGENITVIVNKILKEEPKPLSNSYSPFIHKLIKSLLSKRENHRPEISEILQYKEIKAEIKNIIDKNPSLYKEELSLFPSIDDSSNLLTLPKTEPLKKKSLLKPLSYSLLPDLNSEENKSKVYTPHNPAQNKDDRNSILNVIKKKQTIFSNFDHNKNRNPPEEKIYNHPKERSSEMREPHSAINKICSNEKIEIPENRISFQQYLTKKLTDDPLKNSYEEDNTCNSENKDDDIKNRVSDSVIPQKNKLKNLDMIEEKSYNEEEKGKNTKETSKFEPNNKVKRVSPKNPLFTNFVDKLKISEGVSGKRSKLFLEFLQQRLGEEKFYKIKNFLESNIKQDESYIQMIERRQNEILEIIGVKNIECLKFFGAFFANNETEKPEIRKSTFEEKDISEEVEGRTKSEFLHSEFFKKK